MEITSPVEVEIMANAVKAEPSIDQKETPEQTNAESKVQHAKKEAEIESRDSSEPPAKKLKTEAPAATDEPPMHEMVGGSSVRRFLNQHVTAHLLEGLKQVSSNQPEDPLLALGQFLIQRSKELKEKHH